MRKRRRLFKMFAESDFLIAIDQERAIIEHAGGLQNLPHRFGAVAINLERVAGRMILNQFECTACGQASDDFAPRWHSHPPCRKIVRHARPQENVPAGWILF